MIPAYPMDPVFCYDSSGGPCLRAFRGRGRRSSNLVLDCGVPREVVPWPQGIHQRGAVRAIIYRSTRVRITVARTRTFHAAREVLRDNQGRGVQERRLPRGPCRPARDGPRRLGPWLHLPGGQWSRTRQGRGRGGQREPTAWVANIEKASGRRVTPFAAVGYSPCARGPLHNRPTEVALAVFYPRSQAAWMRSGTRGAGVRRLSDVRSDPLLGN